MLNIETTEGRIYLVQLDPPNEKLEFQFIPQFLDWNRIGNWVSIPIVGRNNSKHHLTGGEDQLSFQLNFNSLFEVDKQLCLRNLSWLQSLTMVDEFQAPARKVKLVWGEADIFRWKVWIVKSVKANVHDFRSNFGMVPTNLLVNIVLELDPDEHKTTDLSGYGILTPSSSGSRNIV